MESGWHQKVLYLQQRYLWGQQWEIQTLIDENNVWVRLVELPTNQAVSNWSAPIERLDSVGELLSRIVELKAPPRVGNLDNFRNADFLGWDWWTFGTPRPIFEFVHSKCYQEEIAELRQKKQS